MTSNNHSFLRTKLENFKKAFESLQRALERDWQHDDGLRDSVIQRFEFNVELSWKFYKEYFDELKLDLKSPKAIFKQLLKFHILDEGEVETALDMLDARNLSSHTYREELAINIASKVKNFLPVLAKMLIEAEKLLEN